MSGPNRRLVCRQRKPNAPCALVCGIYAAIERSSMEFHGHVAEGSWGLLDVHCTQRHLLSSVYVLIRTHAGFFLVVVAVVNTLSVVVRGWEGCKSDVLFFSTSCTTTCDTLGNRTPLRPQTSATLSSGTHFGVFKSLLLLQLFVVVAQTLCFSIWWRPGDYFSKNRPRRDFFSEGVYYVDGVSIGSDTTQW